MKKLTFVLIASIALFTACKKKDVEKTTAEKVIGNWKVNSITSKQVFNGNTTNYPYTGIATDFMDFRADGKIYWNLGGTKDTSAYTIISESKLQFDGDEFDIKVLTDKQMSLFNKTTEPNNPADYYETTFNLGK
jgi:hypothetical protein